MENLKIYLVKISRVKITISLFAVSILAITIVSFSPFDANADYDKITIPEISGTITISESVQNYTNESKIALSVAMAVAENSVEKGKAMWGKLDVVQGFLIYKIGILTSFHTPDSTHLISLTSMSLRNIDISQLCAFCDIG